MCGVLPSEGLSFRLLDFLDLNSSNETAAATITKPATPAPMPAFAPVLRPPDGAFPSEEGDVVGVEIDNVEAEEKGVAEGTVEVGPTVAASSKILFLSLQQVFSPQHQFFPPQFHTPTLPHWSAYCIVSSATSSREAYGDIPLAYCTRPQDSMDCSTTGLYSPVLPRLADPHFSHYMPHSSDKDRSPGTHRLRCQRLQRRYGSSCSMQNVLLRCCMVERPG